MSPEFQGQAAKGEPYPTSHPYHPQMHCLALPRLARLRLALHCIASPCLASPLPCLALLCLAPPCFAPHCLALIVLAQIVLALIVLALVVVLALTVLALIVLASALPCIALHCFALLCPALPCLNWSCQIISLHRSCLAWVLPCFARSCLVLSCTRPFPNPITLCSFLQCNHTTDSLGHKLNPSTVGLCLLPPVGPSAPHGKMQTMEQHYLGSKLSLPNMSWHTQPSTR